MRKLGINIGSTSLKMALLDGEKLVWSASRQHDGDFAAVAKELLKEGEIKIGTQAFVTGNEGRFMFDLPGTLEPLCVEAALGSLGIKADAVVSMGGEDLIVYSLSAEGKIVNNFSGNKCASGTGEFLRQQLARMDMTLEDVGRVNENAKVLPLSTRCSVFMKSDCTHRLNKKEATKDDIVVSLSNVMAAKVADFLARAKIAKGKVVLIGGVTLNSHIIKFIKEKCPEIEFVVPETASVFEAVGAAILAEKDGAKLTENFIKENNVRFGALDSFNNHEDKVRYFEKKEGKVEKGGKYILGVDGGSTTTKVALVDIKSLAIVASHYGRTHGDPVKAVKECLKVVREKIRKDTGESEADIRLVATTGSSREILGVFLETEGIYNEIIAHAVGTTYFDPEVETIFEIGGQDAKYVLLKNGVPIDYAMNEACSAGTGSFLEESAAGDLSIKDAAEIGEIARKADAPCKFGEHCSAFINSDIRKAVQQGAKRENITAGIVGSIVANYLNRVVGNRTIGGKIFLQGGVAKNKAVPLAFAMQLGKQILVPPSPELTGCFGVALLAKRKCAEGLLTESETPFSIEDAITREIGYGNVFTCKSCDNLCPIQTLDVGGHKYQFGGRCNKYANLRKKVKENAANNYIERRQKLLFEDCAAPSELTPRRDFIVGIPRAFSTHTLYPLYSWFFYELGVKTILSTEVDREGVAKTESAYCFPAEIAHGAVQDLLNKGADYILLPHFRDMPSYESEVHANFCPITQAFPYYIDKAFPEVPKEKWLQIVVSQKFGDEKALGYFRDSMRKIKIADGETDAAFRKALAKQNEYFRACEKLGEEALREARENNRPIIAILGRPYNAFTPEANMGIPRKFTSRGFSVVPFDILPFRNEKIFANMYWYYGQQDVKSAVFAKKEPNIYVTYITNFSCAPDSFILHYIKWAMGQKPFLALELDSHTADAGVDTRVEAFLDIIEGYRARKDAIEGERYDNGWRFIQDPKAREIKDQLRLENVKTNEKIGVKGNKRVKVLLANMGAISAEYARIALEAVGVQAEVMPVSTHRTVQIARAHASGKECVPCHLVLGSALEYFSSEKYRKDQIYLLFVPITVGPCRTGQYFVYYENLFRDMGLENVVVFILSDENSYTELGGDFMKELWKGVCLSDSLKDIENSLRVAAKSPIEALAKFDDLWHNLIAGIERDSKSIWRELKVFANEIQKIPLKKDPLKRPKVLIVGEIYVRRDDFVVSELIKLMSDRGIIVKIAGVGEWIGYTDFAREYNLRKLISKKVKGSLRSLLRLKIEMWWKHYIEHKVLKILEPTGLIPETPRDMRKIMRYTEENFVNLELESEISVSSGAAAAAMTDAGYSGVINISPFACLIGRVIEGVFTPWARERNFPVMSVEVDGNLLPPNIINKLNIFMVNVLRRHNGEDLSTLVDAPDRGENKRASRAECECGV
ncbi:MAG: acyl-CoA dehydratase activase [Helicobacteraceae bacterium]|jgi:predicted CoA-substrate-specific enzyme activase|nr:acyl-CoA dehydratase activase [Helicobacteraceae bacterium]